jgi:molybdate transport system substrate-binding protein
MTRFIGLVAVAALAAAGCAGDSPTVRVLAAASLSDVLADIVDDFEAANPDVEVEVVSGGSASLAAQVEEGIDFDVIALADEATMDRVEATGEIATPTVFATNDAVLVGGAEVADTRLADLDRLRFAVCAPEVPCGRAATRLFAELGVTVEPVTFESNVLGVLTKLLVGEVDAGVVYATDLARAGDDVVALDAANGVRITNRYPVALSLAAARAADARADRFVAFLVGPEARPLLLGAGFGSP